MNKHNNVFDVAIERSRTSQTDKSMKIKSLLDLLDNESHLAVAHVLHACLVHGTLENALG